MAPDVRRATILDAASKLLLDHGEFTTAELAAEAGVAEGTIFRYFSDKNTLVEQTQERALALEQLLPQLHAAAALPTLAQRLAAAAHGLGPRLELMGRVLENTDRRHLRSDAIVGELTGVLSRLFEDSSHPGASSEQLAVAFLGSMISNTVLCRRAGVDPIDTDRLVDLFLHGLGPATPPNSAPGTR